MAAAHDVSTFIANFQGGGARANLYSVVLTFPAGIADNFTAQKASFTCTASSLPSSNTGIKMVPYMGRQVKLAGDKTFDDWTITIMNDTDFSVRNAFERWADAISGHASNLAAGGYSNPANYFANATITQLDREGYELKTYNFVDIFPIQVSEIQMGYAQNDVVEEFSVTLAVNYWSSAGITN